jgi:spore coat protein A
MTRLNIYAGLAAFYLIRDPTIPVAGRLNLPAGPYEIELAYKTASSTPMANGSSQPETRQGSTARLPIPDPPILIPEFFGTRSSSMARHGLF